VLEAIADVLVDDATIERGALMAKTARCSPPYSTISIVPTVLSTRPA
jgi:hypothetical protein